MADRIQQRRDTAERWETFNPILLEGEVGYVTDNPNQYKIGDGIHAWNDLPLRGYTGTISQETGDDENAVISQKVVTEKLTELASQVIYDVSANNDGATFASLSVLLSSENLSTLIPTAVRCGGMSIRFVQSSDNNYIQARLMANAFTTDITKWQVVDETPIVGSRNLAESGGVANQIRQIKGAVYTDASDFDNWGYRTNPEIGGVADITTKYQVGEYWYSKIIPCGLGDTFTLSGKGGNLTRLWMFVKASDKTVISKSDANINVSKLQLSCPQNNCLLVVNIDCSAEGAKRELIVNGSILDIQKEIDDMGEEITELNEDVSDIQSKLNNISIPIETIGAYQNTGATIGSVVNVTDIWANQYWRCCKVDCNKGDIFYLVDYLSSNKSWPWNFVRKSDNVLLDFGGSAYINKQKIICPEDDCVLVVNVFLPENVEYSLVKYSKLSELQERTGRIDDVELMQPTNIYCRYITKSSNFPKLNNSIFAEGFIKDASMPVTIDGGKEHAIYINRAFDQKENITLGLDGNTKKIELTEKVINVESPSLANKKALVLCLGESTTVARQKDPRTNEYNGGWGWPSSMREFSVRDKSFNVGADVVTLGEIKHSDTIVTNDQTKDVISSYSGLGGNPLYAFLNWPCRALVDTLTTRFSAETMWYAAGLYSKTPYNASSYNTNLEPYTGSAEQITLITQTPVGKYKIDGSETLWDLLKVLGTTGVSEGFPAFTETGSYSGTSAQITAMQDWMDALCGNPINPYYSLDEARTGASGTAFSLSKYLERYRTMDNAGNRLVGSAGESVVGQDGNTYTIGTRVTNTEDWDVCTPTHVIVNIGINDETGSNTYQNLIENIKTMVSQFTVPTAYFICRQPGANCIGKLGDMYATRVYEPLTKDANALHYVTGWFNAQTNKYLLPIYLIQPPCSQANEYYEDDFVSGVKKLNCGQNDVHPGYFAYKAIGLQCLHWVYSTLT